MIASPPELIVSSSSPLAPPGHTRSALGRHVPGALERVAERDELARSRARCPRGHAIADHDPRSGQDERAAPIVEADDANEPVWRIQFSFRCGAEAQYRTGTASICVEARRVGRCSPEVLPERAAKRGTRLNLGRVYKHTRTVCLRQRENRHSA
jgi:hypothetical protein